jgi:hypothetical protein
MLFTAGKKDKAKHGGKEVATSSKSEQAKKRGRPPGSNSKAVESKEADHGKKRKQSPPPKFDGNFIVISKLKLHH